MTTPTRTDQGFRRARVLRPAACLLGIAVSAAGIPALAFANAAPEAIQISTNSYDTTNLVLNHSWWQAAYLLVVPVFLIARRYPRLAVVGGLIAAVPQCITAHVFVDRFVEAGWGDGLEGFAYLYGFSMSVLFAGAAVLGFISCRRRRRPTQVLVDAPQ